MWGGLSRKRDEHERKLWLQGQARELHEMGQRFLIGLADYRPKRLGIYREDGIEYSSTLSFLSFLINGEQRPIRVPRSDLASTLPYRRIIFGDDALEVRGAVGSTVSLMMSIKNYPEQTAHNMLDHFLTLPVEMVITQSFVFIDQPVAVGAMKEQRRRMEQVQDDAESQIDEIGDALDDLASGRIAKGLHHLTVQVKARGMRELEDVNMPLVSNALTKTTAIAVREDVCMESCYWAQLPGNFKYIARPSMISSRNFASFASLHNYNCGALDGNHWGPAVTLLETLSGTPYYFNWHLQDVGHTFIVAPTGTGKSALNNFLIAMGQKYAPKVFFFDKDFGAYPFVKAMGGVHSTISKGEPSGFNPLQLDDTDANRAFLFDWFSLLLTAHDEELTADDAAIIHDAVRVNYTLDHRDRTLRNVAPSFGKGGAGSLRARIDLWIKDGPYAQLFDNPKDALVFEQALYGFEMGKILDDDRVLPAVVAYLFHRIRLELARSNQRVIIVLEEGARLIRSPYFLREMENWLETIRKLNGMVIFLSPNPAALYQYGSDALIKQTATQIYLANPKATREEYIDHLHLSEGEFETIRSLNPNEHVLLIKHARDSVLAKLDLRPVKWAIPLLSGRPEYKTLIDQLIEQAGTDNPDAWLPAFIQRSTDLL
jgi:type IV secretion system protein VirB4